MNWVDIAVIVVAVISGFIGLRHGLIRAAFTIAGLAGGVILANQYHQSLADMFFPSEAAWSGVAAFAVILVVTLLVASVAGFIVAGVVGKLALGWVDRVVGFIFGLGVGGMLCAIVIGIVGNYLPGVAEAISQSAFAQLLLEHIPVFDVPPPPTF